MTYVKGVDKMLVNGGFFVENYVGTYEIRKIQGELCIISKDTRILIKGKMAGANYSQLMLENSHRAFIGRKDFSICICKCGQLGDSAYSCLLLRTRFLWQAVPSGRFHGVFEQAAT